MRRMGGRGEGKWARISWDEALDEMAERLAAVRQSYGPEAIVGATSGAYFSRSLILALTLRSIGSPELDDQPGPVRRLPGGERTHYGPQHHARRGHRPHPLRAHRGAQSEHSRSCGVGGAEGCEEAWRPLGRGRSETHAGGSDGRPVARAACRHGRGTGFGDDARADQRGAVRPGVRGTLVPRLRRAGQAGGRVHAGGGRGLHGGAGRADRGRGAPVCGRAVDIRERARHRCLQRRRADLPRLSLPGRHQPATSTGLAATCACARPRDSALTASSCICRNSGSTRRRRSARSARTVSAVGRAEGLADGVPQSIRDRGDADGAGPIPSVRSMPAGSTSSSPIPTRGAPSRRCGRWTSWRWRDTP